MVTVSRTSVPGLQKRIHSRAVADSMPGSYPDYACAACAEDHGWKVQPYRIHRCQPGRCGLCGLDRHVMPMRSYGYPRMVFRSSKLSTDALTDGG